MNDRIFEALTSAGLSTSPLSVLDHASPYASAFFALYDNELLYHEAGKNSQVPLRDVTRIHSDREGVLRVETSERTAVTASLLGYDPGRVQAFFQQVRDVTARAKELPVLPLNQAKTEPAGSPLPGGASVNSPASGTTGSAKLPGSSVPSSGMPGLSAYTPAVAPTAPVVVSPAPTAFKPTSAATPDAAEAPTRPTPAQLPSLTGQDGADAGAATPAISAAATSSSAGSAGTAATPPARREAPRNEPVVISSMPPVSDPPAFQERAGERNRQASRAAAPTAEMLTASPVSRPVNLPASAHTQGPLVSVPVVSGPATPNTDTALPELLRRAEGVQNLARTVQLLAVVLGLAAIALAFFQWQGSSTVNGGTLSAIWTLLAGGVGAVALLAFAEALRLLSALARSVQTPSA